MQCKLAFAILSLLTSESLAIPEAPIEVARKDTPALPAPMAKEEMRYVNLTEIELNNALERRGGDHWANIYSGYHCSGNSVGSISNFGCSSTCYQVSGSSGLSVLLYQSTTGNPKPTASFFSDDYCSDQIFSAGIWKGQLSGCTDSPNGRYFRSFHVYYNC